MLTSEAEQILRTIERRLRPAKAPFAGDHDAMADWTQVLCRYESEQVAAAFTAHREAGNTRWPDYYTFRDLLKRARSAAAHPSNPSHNCDICAGYGWAPADDITIINRTYTRVEPCTCPAGQQAERTELWTRAPGLCQACKGTGWFNHTPDEVERCDNCGASGIQRP